MASWDVIVLGLGGVGSAATMHLARAGHRVLGIDQFGPVHAHGSSHGKTRVIRQAYFEHPSYVPLLRRAYELWDELQHRDGRDLFRRNGLVEIGPPDGVVIRGVLASARTHDLSVQEMSMGEVAKTWPGLRGDPSWTAVVERDAGFLRVEDCVDAHLRLASRLGAVCRHHERVRQWQVCGDGVKVITDAGTQSAGHLIIAAGPWASSLLGRLDAPLTVLRKRQYWMEGGPPEYRLDQGFPCFFYESQAGYFYGFPAIDGHGLKVARHSGGLTVDRPEMPPVETPDAPEIRERPDRLERVPPQGGVPESDAADADAVLSFLRSCLPNVPERFQHRASCYYTMTPDEHFIIDRHPEHGQVSVIAGLSGHGFKFTSVLGEIAGQLATGQAVPLATSLFRIDRFTP